MQHCARKHRKAQTGLDIESPVGLVMSPTVCPPGPATLPLVNIRGNKAISVAGIGYRAQLRIANGIARRHRPVVPGDPLPGGQHIVVLVIDHVVVRIIIAIVVVPVIGQRIRPRPPNRMNKGAAGKRKF
jgi:hypothetical protein